MANQKSVSVIMPVFNEADGIDEVVAEHVDELEKLFPGNFEIVCCNDCSTDNSLEKLQNLAEKYRDKVVVISNEKNLGISPTFQKCAKHTKNDLIYMTASDGQWPVENIKKLYASYDESHGLVVGVRENRKEVYTPWRRVISFCFNKGARLIFGVPVNDAGSIKFGDRKYFADLELISLSPFIEAERIICAAKETKISFVSIDFLERGSGKAGGAKFAYLVGALQDLFKCLYKYRLKRSK